LLLSPFGEKNKRVTAELAAERNRFVAAISDEVLIPYAAPGSKTEALALQAIAKGKPLYTFSAALADRGAALITPGRFCAQASQRAPASPPFAKR